MKLTILTTLFGTNSRPDITTTKQEAIPVEKNSPSEPLLISRFDSDVEALRKKYGDLETGLTIEITLQELLKICPRKRKKERIATVKPVCYSLFSIAIQHLVSSNNKLTYC